MNSVRKKVYSSSSIIFIVSTLLITVIAFCHPHLNDNDSSGTSCGICSDAPPYPCDDIDQWALDAIDIQDAWLITDGNSDIRVGIIDTGVWSQHEDLYDNLNTLYDHCYSPDFNTSMYDTTYVGHGTRVAGIIGASHNSFGIDGVCKRVSMTPYRVSKSNYLEDNVWYETACAQSLGDAESVNIDLINFSGSNFYNCEDDFIDAFEEFDGLIVCAAGNADPISNIPNDNDLNPAIGYPSSFPFDNIISVGASDEDDLPASFSNYGQYSVDLFAPGTDIYSTAQFDTYTNGSGTSYAAPLVTGTIALMKSVNPNLTNSQIKMILMTTVDYIEDLSDLCVSGGRLNAFSAVKASIPFLSLGANSSIQPLGSLEHQFYKIVLSPGTYQFETTGSLFTSGYLYQDVRNNPVQSSNNTSGNCSLIYTTTTTQTLYLKIRNNGSSGGSYGIQISETNSHTHSYTSSYIWKNQTQHDALCSCMDSTVQPHAVFSTNPHLCVVCNGYASMGFIVGPFSLPDTIGNDSIVTTNGVIVLGSADYEALMDGSLTFEQLLNMGGNSL